MLMYTNRHYIIRFVKLVRLTAYHTESVYREGRKCNSQPIQRSYNRDVQNDETKTKAIISRLTAGVRLLRDGRGLMTVFSV